jgi:hypothetical protein
VHIGLGDGVNEVTGGAVPTSDVKAAEHIKKYWYLYLAAFLSLFFIGKKESGVANQCVAREDDGRFESFTNGCDKPIIALVCGRLILGSEKCSTNRVMPGAFIHVGASGAASLGMQIISAKATAIVACKEEFTPIMTGVNEFKCTPQ